MNEIRGILVVSVCALLVASCGSSRNGETGGITASIQADPANRPAQRAPCTTDYELLHARPSTVSETLSSVVVPNVVGRNLGFAVCELLSVGLLVSVSGESVHEDVPAADGLLGSFAAGELVPAAGTRVAAGSTVDIRLGPSAVASPPPVPDDHPETVEVPNLVGLTYPEALAAIDAVGGLYVVADLTPFPVLAPEASSLGFDAYVVDAQVPNPGRTRAYLTTTVRLTITARRS